MARVQQKIEGHAVMESSNSGETLSMKPNLLNSKVFAKSARRLLMAMMLFNLVAFSIPTHAEVKGAGNSETAKMPAINTPSYELVCWQAGKEIIRERGLKSAASPGGPGSVITYVTKDGSPSFIVVGSEATCISRAEGK